MMRCCFSSSASFLPLLLLPFPVMVMPRVFQHRWLPLHSSLTQGGVCLSTRAPVEAILLLVFMYPSRRSITTTSVCLLHPSYRLITAECVLLCAPLLSLHRHPISLSSYTRQVTLPKPRLPRHPPPPTLPHRRHLCLHPLCHSIPTHVFSHTSTPSFHPPPYVSVSGLCD